MIHRCSFGKSQLLSAEVWWKQHNFCSSPVQEAGASASSAVLLLIDELLHIQQIYSSCCQSSGAPFNLPAFSAPQLKAHSKEEDGSRGCFSLNGRGKCIAAPGHGAAVFVCLVWFLSRRFHAIGTGWRLGCSVVCPVKRIALHLISSRNTLASWEFHKENMNMLPFVRLLMLL